MKRRSIPGPAWLLVLLLLFLAGCAARPPAPDWELTAHGSLQRYQKAWLAGATRAAEAEFAIARRALASTGRPALVARAELTRCALRVASLDLSALACEGIEPFALDAGDEERAYAAWLQGLVLSPTEVAQLPPQHRRSAAAGEAEGLAAVRTIEDPLSRLVAAGVQVRRGRASPQLVALGVETASSQGWRRPLLAWLGLDLRLAESAGDTVRAAQLRRRIELAARE